jgi:hypothetical protein
VVLKYVDSFDVDILSADHPEITVDYASTPGGADLSGPVPLLAGIGAHHDQADSYRPNEPLTSYHRLSTAINDAVAHDDLSFAPRSVELPISYLWTDNIPS